MRARSLISSDLRGARFRTLSVILSVAVLIGLFFSTSMLQNGAAFGTAAQTLKFGADMILYPPLFPFLSSYEVASGPILVTDALTTYMNYSNFLGNLTHLPGIVAASPQLYVTSLNASGKSSSASKPLEVVAFDPKTDFTIRPWLQNFQMSNIERDEAIAGARTGLGLDDSIRVDNVSLNVVAIASPTNSSLDYSILLPLESAYSLPRVNSTSSTFRVGQASGILIKISQGATLNGVEAEIKNLGQSFRLVEAPELVSRVRADTTGIAAYELIAQIVMAASLIVLMASIFSMTLHERVRQIGLLRSLGATRWVIFRNVIVEASLLAAAGSVVGLLVGSSVLYLAVNYLIANFNIVFPQPTPIEILSLSTLSIVIGVLIGSAASAYPAYRASCLDPYDAIRKGE